MSLIHPQLSASGIFWVFENAFSKFGLGSLVILLSEVHFENFSL